MGAAQHHQLLLHAASIPRGFLECSTSELYITQNKEKFYLVGAAATRFSGCCIDLLLILILSLPLRHKVGRDCCRSIIYSQSQLQHHAIPGMLAGVPQPRSAQAVSGLRRGGGRPYPNQIAPARHGFVPCCLDAWVWGGGPGLAWRWPWDTGVATWVDWPALVCGIIFCII